MRPFAPLGLILLLGMLPSRARRAVGTDRQLSCNKNNTVWPRGATPQTMPMTKHTHTQPQQQHRTPSRRTRECNRCQIRILSSYRRACDMRVCVVCVRWPQCVGEFIRYAAHEHVCAPRSWRARTRVGIYIVYRVCVCYAATHAMHMQCVLRHMCCATGFVVCMRNVDARARIRNYADLFGTVRVRSGRRVYYSGSAHIWVMRFDGLMCSPN